MGNSNAGSFNSSKLLDNESGYESSSRAFTFKILENAEEINLIKDFWTSKQWQHYTDFDYYMNIVIQEEGILRPHIIVVFENENPIFLLIGNIREKGFKLKLGYKSLLNIKVRFLGIMYGGVLGNQSPSVCKETVYFLKKILATEKIDYVLFKELNVDSNIYKAIKNFGGKLYVSKFDLLNPHIYMDLPDSFEKYLETKNPKKRHEIKRRIKKFERDLQGRIEFKLYQRVEDLNIIMKDTEEVASQTYQSKLGVTLNYDNDTREMLQFELEKGRLRAFILYIDGKPAAYSTCLVYRKSFLGSKTGYLQEYSQYRPGSYLMMKTINYLCDSGTVNKVDFGFGDAEWKRDFSTSINIESSVFIYSSTLKGFLLNFIGTFNRVTLMLYRKLSVRYDMIRRIKKKSRDRLTNGK